MAIIKKKKKEKTKEIMLFNVCSQLVVGRLCAPWPFIQAAAVGLTRLAATQGKRNIKNLNMYTKETESSTHMKIKIYLKKKRERERKCCY
jgi:hypothetical protein